MKEISMAVVVYEPEDDILMISRTKKPRVWHTIEALDDILVDFGLDGRIESVEILNASKNLGVKKRILKNVERAELRTVNRGDFIGVVLRITAKDGTIIKTDIKPICMRRELLSIQG